MRINRDVVIVPGARLISDEMRFEYGHIPPVLLPANGGNVIQGLMALYDPEVYSIVIGCHEGKELVSSFVDRAELTLKVIDSGKTYDVGHTVYKSLRALGDWRDEGQSLYINYGDTLFLKRVITESLQYPDCIVTSVEPDPWRWSVVYQSDNGHLTFIHKDMELQGEHPVVTGLIRISEVPLFIACLQEAILESLEASSESLYLALSKYSRKKNVAIMSINRDEWIDLGHPDKINTSRHKLRARSFNEMEIDEDRGMVTKRSLNFEKLAKEIEWYIKLPRGLEYLVPRIFDYSIDSPNVFVKMEYYGYPSLADIFVHGRYGQQKWEEILHRLKWMVDELASYRVHLPVHEIHQIQTDMYIKKTKDRLQQYKLTAELEAAASVQTVNDKRIHSLQKCLDNLDVLFEWIIEPSDSFTVLHGDLCLSNILYDARSKIFRLIDPRGSFGNQAVFGDQQYDLAKLSHSFCGFYDFIVRDQFFYHRSGTNVTFRTFQTPVHEQIKASFKRIVLNNDLKLVQAVDFIEALLFLSMIPLHDDSEQRQVAMLLTGLEKMTPIIDQYEKASAKILVKTDK